MLTSKHGAGCVFERRKAVLLGIFTIQQSTTGPFEKSFKQLVLAEALVVVLAVVLTVALAVALAVAGPLDVTRSID